MNIKKIIIEEAKELFENLQIYTIPQLAQMLSRMGFPEKNLQIFQKMLLDAYKQGGDDAVVNMYQEISGVQIEALRNGRYVFSSVGGGGEPQLQEIEDNAFHTPDEMPS